MTILRRISVIRNQAEVDFAGTNPAGEADDPQRRHGDGERGGWGDGVMCDEAFGR